MKTAKTVNIAIQIMGRVIGIVASQMNSGKQKMFRAERKVIMTENDAIYCLKAESERFSEVCEECQLYGEVGCDHCFDDATDVAIKALEDIQAYRALGTVEEIQKAIENLPLHKVEHKLLQEYQTIGTVRECKIAVERMKPKKPDYEADGYADGQLVYDYAKCPICGHDFEYGINDWECKYCSDCGQKLDWK